MTAQLVNLDFEKAKGKTSKRLDAKTNVASVSCLFAGHSARRPDLFTVDILNDIKDRITECESFGDFSVKTRNYLRQQPASGKNDDLWEAEMRFYLDKPGEKIESYPFLVLRAEHKRHPERPYEVNTVYSLANGLSNRHRACAQMVRGENYAVEIAPTITQKLLGALVMHSYDNGAGAYEAWTPN